MVEKMEAAQDNSFQKFGGEGKGHEKEVPRNVKGVEGMWIEETRVCFRAGGEH